MNDIISPKIPISVARAEKYKSTRKNPERLRLSLLPIPICDLPPRAPIAAAGELRSAPLMDKDAATRPLTPEEEALKRNTDCVYFLASPLTCKKGSECDYRHSEVARLNPRDCYFWMSGNCLNPKCSFRHPPLDALFGVPGTPSVPALPPKQVPAHQVPGKQVSAHQISGKQVTAHQVSSNNSNKPSVPCFFFQKGQCLKGDKCAFIHGPQPTGPPPIGTTPHQVAKFPASVSQPPQTFKKEWTLKECTSQPSIPKAASIARPVELPPPSVKPVKRAEIASNDGLILQRSTSAYPQEFEHSRSQPTNVPVGNGVTASVIRSNQPQHVDQRHQNGRNADEFLGESSPGFDVLVDGDIGDSDYHNNEDDYGRESAQAGRNLYPATDFDFRLNEYEPYHKLDRDQLNGKDKYDSHDRKHSQYGREHRRSSERIGDGRSMAEWRVRHREESPDEIDGLDLRHRLKQRRLNGPRPVVSPDRHGESRRRDDHYVDHYVDGERYRGRHSHRDQRRVPPESSIRTRLQGRIKLPGRLSPDRALGMRSERERDRARPRGRLSPPRLSSHPERTHDRVKRRSSEELATDGRSFRSQIDDSDPLNFAGPKSLAELKSTKESSQERSNKSVTARLSTESGNTVGFQDVGTEAMSVAVKPVHGVEESKATTTEEEEEGLIGEADTAEVEEGMIVETAEGEEEGLVPEAAEVAPSPAKDATTEMVEEMVVETAEDAEVEDYEQKNEESDYYGVDDEGAKAEDKDILYDDDYLDDDDEDDDDEFARKVALLS